MSSTIVGFDPTLPTGSRFLSPAVQAEIEAIIPGNLPPQSIPASALAPGAVTTTAIQEGAVTSDSIAAGGVEAANLAPGAVTTAAIATGAVTSVQTGIGVVTSTDVNGNAVALTIAVLTWAQFYALQNPDPNTLYFLTSFL